MKYTFYILFFFFVLANNAQIKNDSVSKTSKKYLEDQLYAGVTYNLLSNKPSSIDLRGFSNTMFVGYIRDFPLNINRNLGIGIGLGYAQSTYFHNMKISIENKKTIFSDFKDIDDYDSNKLVFHTIDLPFEFRIRNSTLQKDKFFRLYLGMKLSYVLYHKAEYNLEGSQKISNFDHFNKLQYGLTSSIGYGTWNGYFYYGLTNLFDGAKFNNTEELNMKSFRFGLIFYIL